MNCKYCASEMEETETVCPVCGADNTADTVAEEMPPVPGMKSLLEIGEPEPGMEEPALGDEPPELYDEQPQEAEEPVLGDENVDAPAAPTAKKINKGMLLGLIAAGVAVLALVAYVVLRTLGVAPFAPVKDVFDRETFVVSDEQAQSRADDVIATCGDHKLTNGLLQVYYWMQVTDYLNYYGPQFDYTKSLATQYYSKEQGITWQQYFLDVSLQTWYRYVTLCSLAEEDGHVLSDTQIANLEQLENKLTSAAQSAGYETAQQMLVADMGASATVDAYKNFMREYTVALSYFNSRYQSLEPTAEELDAYYEANITSFQANGIIKGGERLVDVRHILLYPEGAVPGSDNTNTCTEDQWEACRMEAEALLEQWKQNPTEDHFIQLAAQYSGDSSAANGGLIADIYRGRTVANFDAWCFDESRAYGDCEAVKTEYGYHLIFFVNAEEEWVGTARNAVISEKANKIIDDGQARWPMKVKYRSISLGDVVFGTNG